MGDLVIQMGEMVGRRRRKDGGGAGGVSPDRLMLDIMEEVNEKKKEGRNRKVSDGSEERSRKASGDSGRFSESHKPSPDLNGHSEVKVLDAVTERNVEERESPDLLGELRERKVSELPSGRQRKVSHRKVIIHDDGEICQQTYNKTCPYGHEDPLHSNPPMFHEMGGGEVPQGLFASMGGGGPEMLMRMAAMGGGGGMEGIMAAMGGGGEGGAAINPEMMMRMAAMGAMAGGGMGGMGGMGGLGGVGGVGGGGEGGGGGMVNPEMMMRMAMAMGGMGGGGMGGGGMGGMTGGVMGGGGMGGGGMVGMGGMGGGSGFEAMMAAMAGMGDGGRWRGRVGTDLLVQGWAGAGSRPATSSASTCRPCRP